MSHHNLVQAFFSSDEDMAHYICDQCGKSFTLGTNLSRHKQVHVNGKFSCNNCFLKFSSQLSLDQHRRNVHGVVENPSGFCCEICGKSYKQKKHMIRHQQSHTKQDHKCNTCNSTFKTERNLTEHNLSTWITLIVTSLIIVTSVKSHQPDISRWLGI